MEGELPPFFHFDQILVIYVLSRSHPTPPQLHRSPRFARHALLATVNAPSRFSLRARVNIMRYTPDTSFMREGNILTLTALPLPMVLRLASITPKQKNGQQVMLMLTATG